MKKLIISFLIFLCLSLNIIRVIPVYALTSFKEGIYKLEDFNFSPDNLYSVQNATTTDTSLVLLFDENQLIIQTIALKPNSPKIALLPLKPNYRLVILGQGRVIIS
ncbi:hypothetical protein SAMN02745163_03955 [Clostridium cavendishii DSM 21758]|uniref:Uncharacterized protein n=1 Tax=Clostridium cavendishii DSM 21758 TaxID=1121302 RepID=A0A1M6T5L3_9CLOT|nr:hypothetical protein [Clostridium cavendishii]SHK52230.1 hypothetical protein SAMN02745163_03955 [Clostridium cavendishii DSM 21758]